MSRVAAFFDMDKTIIAENSASLYLKQRYDQGEVSGWDIARGLGAYLQYKVGVLDVKKWTESMMAEYKGRTETDLLSEGHRLFDLRLRDAIYPEALELIREHQKQGHTVAIVSGAIRFIVEPMADFLGVDHFLFTGLQTENGRLTGEVVEPLCLDEGKIYWIQQLIDDQGIDLARSYFYTDSVTDLPLLELVGHPIITNPDPLLYRTAVRRRWPVRFFDAPA